MDDESPLLYAIGSGLVSAVVYLFKLVQGLNKQQLEMSVRLGELKGEHAGIERLSAEVLEEVRNLKHGGEQGGDA